MWKVVGKSPTLERHACRWSTEGGKPTRGIKQTAGINISEKSETCMQEWQGGDVWHVWKGNQVLMWVSKSLHAGV